MSAGTEAISASISALEPQAPPEPKNCVQAQHGLEETAHAFASSLGIKLVL
jgi:hypothetical protein